MQRPGQKKMLTQQQQKNKKDGRPQKQFASAKEVLQDNNLMNRLINEIFDSADTNRSGLISQKEFSLLISIFLHEIGLPTPSQQQIGQAFVHYDKNRSGFLSREEFHPLAVGIIEWIAERQEKIEEEIRQQKAKAEQQRIFRELERVKKIAELSFRKLVAQRSSKLKDEGKEVEPNLGIGYYEFNKIFMVMSSFLQVEDPTQEQIDQMFDDIDLNDDENISLKEFMGFLDQLLRKLLSAQGKARFTWGSIIQSQRENIFETIYSDKIQLRKCVQLAFAAGDLDGSKTLENAELPLVFSILAQQLHMPTPAESRIAKVTQHFGNVLTLHTFEQAVDALFHILIEEENKRIEFEMRNKQKISWKDLFTSELKLKRFTQNIFRQFSKGKTDYLEYSQLDVFISYICSKLSLEHPSSKVIRRLKLEFDVNKDGRFTVEEFQQILYEFLKAAQIAQEEHQREKMKQESEARRRQKIQSLLKDQEKLEQFVQSLFQQLDIEEDGAMDPYEFSYGLEHLARFYKLPIPDSEECADILRYYDKDEDQTISQKEFKRIIVEILKSKLDQEVFTWKTKKAKTLQEIVESEELKRGLIIIFKAADKDKSGAIEEEELDDVLKQVSEFFSIPIPTDDEIDWALSQIQQKDEDKLSREEYEQFVLVLLWQRINAQEQKGEQEEQIANRYEPFVKELFAEVNRQTILYQDVQQFGEELNAASTQMKEITDKLRDVHKERVWKKFDDYDSEVYKKMAKAGKKNIKSWVKSIDDHDLIKKPLDIEIENVLTLEGKQLLEWQKNYLKSQLPTLERMLDSMANQIHKENFMQATNLERNRKNLAKEVKKLIKEIRNCKEKLESPQIYMKIIELLPKLQQLEEYDQIPVQSLQQLCRKTVSFAHTTLMNVQQIQHQQQYLNN